MEAVVGSHSYTQGLAFSEARSVFRDHYRKFSLSLSSLFIRCLPFPVHVRTAARRPELLRPVAVGSFGTPALQDTRPVKR